MKFDVSVNDSSHSKLWVNGLMCCLLVICSCTDPNKLRSISNKGNHNSEHESFPVRQITREELALQNVIYEGFFETGQYTITSNIDSVAKLLTICPNFQLMVSCSPKLTSIIFDCDSPPSASKCFDCAIGDTTVYLLSVISDSAKSRLIIGTVIIKPCNQNIIEIPVHVLQGLFNRPRLKLKTVPYILDIDVFGFRTRELIAQGLLVL
jgi:hypothetical protein